MKTNDTFAATIESGLAAVREWKRGDTVHLKTFEQTYLTRKGCDILRDGWDAAKNDDVAMRQLMTKAVAAGNY